MLSKACIIALGLVCFFMAIQIVQIRKEVKHYKKMYKQEQNYSEALENAHDAPEILPTKTRTRSLMKKNENNEKKN